MKIIFICIWLSIFGGSNYVFIDQEVIYTPDIWTEYATAGITRIEICTKEKEVFEFRSLDTIDGTTGEYIIHRPDFVYKYNLKTKELTECKIEPVIKKTKRMEEKIDEEIIGYKLK